MKQSGDDRIFVFGSNLAGRHGAGAARFALDNHGAIYGQAEGLQGQSYGIPTKNAQITQALSLEEIAASVKRFKAFATQHPELRFQVTRIGCGLAGFSEKQIAPMFYGSPSNAELPEGFIVSVIGVTGHRPEKLGMSGLDLPSNPIFRYVMIKTKDILDEIKPSKVITGMALGYDQWVAQACIYLGIPFVAYVPCDGQEAKWPAKAQEYYNSLLKQAESVKVLSPGPYTVKSMHIRNQAIVDNCDILVACYNSTPGGTESCLRYAIRTDRKLWIIDPRAFTHEDADSVGISSS